MRRHASCTESNCRMRKKPAPPYPSPRAGEDRVGEGRGSRRNAANTCRGSVGARVRASYDPLDPPEPWWNGGAELGVGEAGLELGGAGAGDAGFGAAWLAGWLGGAAGAAGRGAIGDAPTCVGEGDAGPAAGGVAETGRGGAGGANGFGTGGGT